MATVDPAILFMPVEQADGPLQMARDEVMLQQAEQGIASFRIYLWSEPTLSIGYFQNANECLKDAALANLPLVRRMTGGGAIVHGQQVALSSGATLTDWTYALALPARLVAGKPAYQWHDAIHGALCTVLGTFGLAAEILPRHAGQRALAPEQLIPSGSRPLLSGAAADLPPSLRGVSCLYQRSPAPGQHQEPASSALREGDPPRDPDAAVRACAFLCFARPAPGDVVWCGRKIVGSAQRLRRGALLQHGAIFLPHWPCDAETLARLWLAELGWSVQTTTWSQQQLQQARELAERKYRQPSWNLRR